MQSQFDPNPNESKEVSKPAPQSQPHQENDLNASNLTAGFILLHHAKLLKPAYRKLLSEHPQDAIPLAKGLVILNQNQLVLPEHQILISQHPKYAAELAQALANLHIAGLAAPEYLAVILKHHQDPIVAADRLIRLNSAGKITPENQTFICDLVTSVKELFSIDTAIDKLISNGLLAPEYQKLIVDTFRDTDYPLEIANTLVMFKLRLLTPEYQPLILDILRTPRFSVEIAQAYATLEDGGLFTLEDQTLFSCVRKCQPPELIAKLLVEFRKKGLLATVDPISLAPYTFGLHNALLRLKGPLDTPEYRNLLLRNPKMAFDIVTSLIELQKQQLLTPDNQQLLLTMPFNLAYGLILLKQAALLTPEYQELLEQHPDHANSLASGIIKLAKGGMLPEHQTLLLLLVRNPALAASLADILILLKKVDSLNSECTELLFYVNNSHQIQQLQNALDLLAKIEIPTREKQSLALLIFKNISSISINLDVTFGLIKSPEARQSLISLLTKNPEKDPSIPQNAPILWALDELMKAKLPIQQYEALLAEHPRYAFSLTRGLVLLKKENLFTPQYQELLTQNPQNAATLAEIRYRLKLTAEQEALLFKYPKHAVNIVKCYKHILEKISLYSETIPFEDPQYISPIESLLSMLSDANILTRETLDLLIKHQKYSPHILKALEASRPITKDLFYSAIGYFVLQEQKQVFIMGSLPRLNATGPSWAHFFNNDLMDINIIEGIFSYMPTTAEPEPTAPKPVKGG